jgi:multidrug resistance protein, MATE family
MQPTLYTNAKKTILLSLPIIFGELAQMALHIIDTAMAGALGYKQLAAAALVLGVLTIPFVIGIGMTISVSQLVSMHHGRKDNQQVSHYFYNGFWVCAITALLISLTLVSGKNILFHLNQDAEVAQLAVPFMQLMGWSVIPMLLFMSLKQFTDGLQHTRTAMLISLLAMPVNILINWLLIFGNWGFPRLELAGAGWGTLITRSLMFISLGAVILWHPLFSRYIKVRKTQWVLRKDTIKALLYIGIPSGLQVGMEAGAFAVSGLMIGAIGAVEQAAHQIALSLASLTFMVSMGLAQGSSIRVSNAYGAKDPVQILSIGKSTLIAALLYGLACAVIFVIFNHRLPLAFNSNLQVVKMAALFLLFAAVFQISDATQAIGAGLLRGIKDVKVPTLLIGIAYWVVGIPVGYLLAFKAGLGAAGVWIGFIAGLSCSSIFLCIRFLKMGKKI